jgi:hypothetical protein
VGLSYITMKNILTPIAATVAVAVLAQSAQAMPIGYKRFVKYQDGFAVHDIAIVGQTPGAVSILDLEDWVQRNVIADKCGMAKFPPSSKYPVNQIITAASGLNSSSHNQDIANLPVLTLPTCNAATGVLSATVPPEFKTADGTIVKIDGPLGQTQIYYEKRVKAKANAAGLVTLKGSFMSGFRIGATTYSTATMPSVTALPIVRMSGTDAVIYVPSP